MKLTIQRRRQFFDSTEYFNEIETIEIREFIWGKNHEFKYVPYKDCRYHKLEENEEIIGLTI